jgi:hypothetical protein
VTGTRPERPILATVICVYEAFIVLGAIVAFFSLKFLVPLTTHAAVHRGPTLAASAINWVSCLLAMAAAITLWQMRRSSVLFLGARFGMALVLFLVGLFHPIHAIATPHSTQGLSPANIAHAFRILGVIALALSGFIAWYAYKITAPHRFLPESAEPELTS